MTSKRVFPATSVADRKPEQITSKIARRRVSRGDLVAPGVSRRTAKLFRGLANAGVQTSPLQDSHAMEQVKKRHVPWRGACSRDRY